MGVNRFVGWRLIASALLTLMPVVALAQGRPDIVWVSAGHSSNVSSLAYSPDGQFLVSGSNDRTIKLWRQDGTFVRTFAIPYDINAQLADVLSVAVSPDGTLIGAGVEQYHASSQTFFGAVQIWRISDGLLVHNFTGYGAEVLSVAFSPNGQYIASGSADRSVKVWEIATETLISTHVDHTQRVNGVAFSNDGQWLASASDDRTANLYRTSDWGLARTLTGHTNVVQSLAFSPNSTTLATGSFDQTVRLWNVSNGNLVSTLIHGSQVLAVAFAPDGTTLASGLWDKSIKLWDPEQGQLLDTLLGHTAIPLTLAFAPDSQILASGSWFPEFAIKLWGDREGARPPRITNHSSSINDLTFAPNHQLVSAGDTTARFWEGSNGRFLSAIDATTDVLGMALSPDGQMIALPGPNHTVKVYRVSDGTLLQTLVGHTQEVTGLAFSHNGTLLASGGSFDGSNDVIKLWNTSNWSLVRELSGQFLFGPFVAISFSTNDAFISATCEGTPAVWRVSDGAFLHNFAGGGLTRFSQDGTLIAVGSAPVRIYRTSAWAQVASLSDQNQALAFTPDGRFLALGGRDQIQFWRVSDWSLQRFYDQELGYAISGISSLTFSLDGSQFAYGRSDAVVIVATNPVTKPKARRGGERRFTNRPPNRSGFPKPL